MRLGLLRWYVARPLATRSLAGLQLEVLVVYCNAPLGSSLNTVKFRLAQFAVVFFRQVPLVVEAHTASMLPDEAFVALNEKITGIFVDKISCFSC